MIPTDRHGAARRSFLVRGILTLGSAVAGAFALSRAGAAATPELAAPAPELSPAPAETVRLLGLGWHVAGADRPPGALPALGDRQTMRGEVFDSSAERRLGRFYGVSLCVDTPTGPSPYPSLGMQLHTFDLDGGTLLGIGAAPSGEGTFAIVGGTGAFLGASGSYVARQRPRELGGDGTAELTFTLTKGWPAHGV